MLLMTPVFAGAPLQELHNITHQLSQLRRGELQIEDMLATPLKAHLAQTAANILSSGSARKKAALDLGRPASMSEREIMLRSLMVTAIVSNDVPFEKLFQLCEAYAQDPSY